MPTVWWDDSRQFRIDAGSGPYAGSVPEEIPRERWSEWDKMRIGGMDVPGHVVLVSRKQKTADVLNVAGQDGATINHLGVQPVEMDLTITLWTPAQFVAYERLLSLVLPKAFPTGNSRVPRGIAAPQFLGDEQSLDQNFAAEPSPTVEGPPNIATSFEVQHPPLNIMGVRAIYIHEIGTLIAGPVFGAKVTVWRAMERREPAQIQIVAANGMYSAELRPVQGRPTPTQPVTKPSLSAVGPD